MSSRHGGNWEPRLKYDRGSDNPSRPMDIDASDALEVPAIVVLTQPPVTTGTGPKSIRFNTPQGWYWEILSLCVPTNLAAPVAAQPMNFGITDGTISRWAGCLFVGLNIGGFSGPVVWARDAGDAVDLTSFVQTQAVPRTVIRGGWTVDVSAPDVGNLVGFDESTLILRAVAPVAALTRSALDVSSLE